MCGHNQTVLEKGILRQHMIAVASGMIRDDIEITFSECEEYSRYTEKMIKEKKAKNRFLLPKRALKNLLKKLNIKK